MLELLSRHAEQKEEFLNLNKKECHNPLVVLPILRQLGLIKAYPIDEPQE
jgi:hypothetical protein